jgi:hypothetical protein
VNVNQIVTVETIAVENNEPCNEYLHPSVKDYPWENSFLSQFIAEVILQLVNASTTGRIAHFAATHRYYIINREYYSLPHSAHLMYGGALFYTIAVAWLFPYLLGFSALGIRELWERDLSQGPET